MTLQQIMEEARAILSRKDWAHLDAFIAQHRAELSDPFMLVNLGIVGRDGHRYEAADAIFIDILNAHPGDPYAPYELGVSLTLQGRHLEALAAFERGIAMHPADERLALQTARLSLMVGETDRADEIAGSFAFSAVGVAELRHIYATAAFMTAFPVSRALRIAAAVNEEAGGVMPHDVVGARIFEAARAGAPFMLLRAGDGEGSYTVLNALDEVRHEHLYRRNREEFASYWFGDLPRPTVENFQQTACVRLASALAEADILGLPSANWVAHEYKIFSSRGISALTNLYRLARTNTAHKQNLCQQDIHIGLGSSNFFAEFFKEFSRVSVISCFPELPAALAERFGAQVEEFIKIPGEKYFAGLIGEEAAAGQHYPDRFEQVMTMLQARLDGRLFLVAGGILGKFYCQQVRRSGGIALDIGSLADVWVKKLTRPGYENLRAAE